MGGKQRRATEAIADALFVPTEETTGETTRARPKAERPEDRVTVSAVVPRELREFYDELAKQLREVDPTATRSKLVRYALEYFRDQYEEGADVEVDTTARIRLGS